jgi:hypothetical protein
MRIIIQIFILFINIFIQFQNINSYCYTTNIKLRSRRNLCDTAANFMNLNEILNDNSNKVKIRTYNNQTMSFNYNTYSNFNEYKYNNKYLLLDKNNYYASYSFNIDNTKYKYVFKINTIAITDNRTLWNIKIKYNYDEIFYINDVNQIIYRTIISCLNKKPTSINPILNNFFYLKK